MTTTRASEQHRVPASAAPPSPTAPRHHTDRGYRGYRWTVGLAVLAAVLVRLPFLAVDATRDEAGYLLVGQQWHAGGSSLYGSYWVDRPPLLISVFGAAARLGGLVPLRLLGALATALVVVGAAHLARRLGGPRAGGWAAVTAAALCVTPLLGGEPVNGELLSAPFVVAGLVAFTVALDQQEARRAVVAAGLAGAAAAAAILVKQNMADVAVFGAATASVAWLRGDVRGRRVGLLALASSAGALADVGVVALWTTAHGTSVPGVFDAMYPFRVQAGRVLAHSSRTTVHARLWGLAWSWVLSGGAVLTALVAHALAAGRLRSPAAWGLATTVVFDVVSVLLGGSYWTHYLIQLVVPVSVLAGLVVPTGRPGHRSVVGAACVSAVCVSAVIALAAAAVGERPTAGTAIGEAVRASSEPTDTIVTTWGHADITRASGLRSPYPYLWSLPAHTLDPRLLRFDALLAGPAAPTWLVTGAAVRRWGFHGGEGATARILAARYRAVARFDHRTIYLRRGLHRSAPRATSPRSPRGLSALVHLP